MSLRYALKYFYDINTPLKQSVIKKLAQRASDINEKNKLNELANVFRIILISLIKNRF